MASVDGYSLYSLATGEIRCQVGGLETAQNTLGSGEAILEGRWDDSKYYVPEGSPILRPALFPGSVANLPADGVTVVQAHGVPPGTRVRVNRGDWQAVDDGVFEFVTAIAGEYEIDIEPPFPCQQQSVRVLAHAV
jgi:hypothetical protein